MCTLRLTYQCAPNDGRTSLGLELSVSIVKRKESYIFVGSCLVSVVSSSRTICTGRTLSHRTGAKEEDAAFERVMLRGPEAIRTALALLGEVSVGDSVLKS